MTHLSFCPVVLFKALRQLISWSFSVIRMILSRSHSQTYVRTKQHGVNILHHRSLYTFINMIIAHHCTSTDLSRCNGLRKVTNSPSAENIPVVIGLPPNCRTQTNIEAGLSMYWSDPVQVCFIWMQQMWQNVTHLMKLSDASANQSYHPGVLRICTDRKLSMSLFQLSWLCLFVPKSWLKSEIFI